MQKSFENSSEKVWNVGKKGRIFATANQGWLPMISRGSWGSVFFESRKVFEKKFRKKLVVTKKGFTFAAAFLDKTREDLDTGREACMKQAKREFL